MSALHDLLAEDHERLDALLSRCADDEAVDMVIYDQFRRGLLRHIGIEERLLFPALRKRGGNDDLVDQLHRDHAALAALLMPPPTHAEIEQIRTILDVHNPLEEGQEGMYAIVEDIAGDELARLLSDVEAFPAVRLAPHADTAVTRWSIDQLVQAAAEGRLRFPKGPR